MENDLPGRIAYEAYREHCGGKSIRGEDLPSWDSQLPVIRSHWQAVAKAVIALMVGDGG